jgi:hypothetical protein
MPSSLILLPIGPPVARQRRDRAVGPVKSENHQIRRVILPFLPGRGRKTYAAIFGFIAGVMPPMPICGRAFLYIHKHYVAKCWASSMLLMMYWFSQIGPRKVRFLTVFRMVPSQIFVTLEKATLRT